MICGLGNFERKGKFIYSGEFENGQFSGAGWLIDSEKLMMY